MTKNKGVRFGRLLALVEKSGEFGLVKSMLLESAAPVLVPAEMPAFQQQCTRLSTVLQGAGVAPALLDLYLLTRLLVHGAHLPAWFADWLRERTKPADGLGGVALSDAMQGLWGLIPILACRDDRVCYRFVVAGVIPADRATAGLRFPDWTPMVLDDEAFTAFVNAFGAASRLKTMAQDRGMCAYPLLDPDGTIQIRGGSLGLPLALGFLDLMHGRAPSALIAASGKIDLNGAVRTVGHLQGKISMAETRGHRIFLYPDGNAPAAGSAHRMERLPVSDLDEAWMLSELYRIDPDHRLGLFRQVTKDAALLADSSHRLSPKWLRWSVKNGLLEDRVREIVAHPARFDALSKHYMECTDRFELATADAMAAMIDAGRLEKAARVAPLAAFRWAAADIARRNHHGRPLSAQDPMARLAWSLKDTILSADLQSVIAFYNHLLVARHNRYEFMVDPPGELDGLLPALEQRHQQQVDCGCSVDMPLGRLYGTLVQNCAFCGPECIDRTVQYSQKARRALGEGTVPEHREAWLRQYNYLAYAYLDATDSARAEACLKRYLGCDEQLSREVDFAALSRWQHAALARYLSEVKAHEWLEAYLSVDPDRAVPVMGDAHPSQLWYKNMGRIYEVRGQTDKAVSAYRKSLALCLRKENGPTINVMALMPLAHLHALGALAKGEGNAALGAVVAAARHLDEHHFEILQEGTLKAVAEKVRACPERWFPFTYR